MHRSSYNTYSDTFLDSLAEKVLTAFINYRKAGLNGVGVEDIDVYKIPNSVHNSYYHYFKIDIEGQISRQIGVGTIFRLLKRTKNTFEEESISTFEKYVNKIVTPNSSVEKNLSKVILKGAYYIDSAFHESLLDSKYIYTLDGFYLSKQDKDYQWIGIMRGWDYVREVTKTIQAGISNCFKSESRVASVIHGPGGCGKSTTLRRLAFDCMYEQFNVTWLKDLDYFFQFDLETISNTEGNYLLIIESWDSFEDNKDLINKFLLRIKNIENIRLVIGDRYRDEREYDKYMNGEMEFEIELEENGKIIKKILGLNQKWENTANKILSVGNINDIPIFLILFVLSRSSEQNNLDDINDVKSRFEEIIKSDLNQISQTYKGLAMMLYYWGTQNNPYTISWYAFLKLADHFNGNTSCILERLLDYKQNTPIHKILFHYFSLRGFIDPDAENLEVLFPHHNLLMIGLSKAKLKGWHPMDLSIRIEITNVLINNNLKRSSREFALSQYNTEFDSYFRENYTHPFIGEFWSMATEYWGFRGFSSSDRELSELYNNANKIKARKYWVQKLFDIIYDDTHSDRAITIILTNIIERGCKSKFVLDIYNIFKNNQLEKLEAIFHNEDPNLKVSRGYTHKTRSSDINIIPYIF